MQIYILNRAKQTLATTASIYDDTHTMSLTAGSSSYEFKIDKADDASTSLETGNYIVLQDDNKKTWLFTILEVTEGQNSKTVYAEDAGIELINKAVDVWSFDEAHDFEYYFDLITEGTPWELGTNQLNGLSRTLKFEGRDTGLGRLLSVLKAFDNAECRFNVEFSLTEPVKFTVDVAKAIGNIRDDIQIVYNAELNNITKTESRAEFVTALCGVGGTLESEDGQQTTTVDFSDLEYNQDGLYTTKGDKFLYAVDANKKFNPGDTGYIENFFEYDTQSASELLNRTITKLKTYSEPQLTYEVDVKIIDGSLKIGDKVTIIDHDFNPAVYLTARVSTLVKSYTDSTKNTITFTNYELINSNVVLQNKVETIKNQITKLPTQQTVNDLKDKVINVSQQVDDAVSGVEDAKQNAQDAVNKAEQAIADAGLASDKADKVNEIAQSAQENAQNAINNAQSAIANAQNAISNAQKAQETANNAISNAQNAINQASSAGTVANAAKQDVINLKGGSTATVAELENGLALKLERKDLNGYATESWTTTQISASADGLSAEIGKVSDNLNTKYANLNVTVNGIQSTVANKADKSTVTQLANTWQAKLDNVNKTTTASITAVRDDLTASINLKVSKNDVVNQINVDTSGVLIQGKKVHITGQTVIDNAVIKSAMIDTITADKIKTGTLNSLNINNGNGAFVVDSSGNVLISGGIITDNKVADERKLTIDLSNSKIRLSSGDNVYGLNLTTTGIYSLTNQTYMQMIDKSSLENAGFYFKTPYNFNIETGTNKIVFKGQMLTFDDTVRGWGADIYLNDWKQFVFQSSKTAIVSTEGEITLQAKSNVVVETGGFIVKGAANIGYLRVERDFSVGGSKNSSVKTSQGWTLINAYETAEYYFGDVGFAETGSGNKVKVMIDPIFLETVNTEDYQYHVFLSAYNSAKLWVSERQKDYFIVESDAPNVKFSYEIKAKRRGYEDVRLAIDKNMKGSAVDG